MTKTIACKPKSLPPGESTLRAARRAFEINPANRPHLEGLLHNVGEIAITPARLAVSRRRYWGPGGVHLTVSFLGDPPAELRARILSHMNAWSETANVAFVETQGDGQVRIARTEGDGYWSYLGTDILEIPLHQPTMNLDSFTMQTEESEFRRVVRHEAGHTLGFVHEHLRRELVERIDRDKAIEYFRDHYGWPEEMTVAQVLTPLEEGSLLGTSTADARSIMCYQLPGKITTDGQPIIGGVDIDPDDAKLAAKLYPRSGHQPAHTGARATNGHSPIMFVAITDSDLIADVIAATQRARPDAP
ncbi:MAG TPA: M12 family metallopeptidase [Kofleriaceae bacterium]|nr:M12 family metallopeptidase [Kofleriaceae bacterium]